MGPYMSLDLFDEIDDPSPSEPSSSSASIPLHPDMLARAVSPLKTLDHDAEYQAIDLQCSGVSNSSELSLSGSEVAISGSEVAISSSEVAISGSATGSGSSSSSEFSLTDSQVAAVIAANPQLFLTNCQAIITPRQPLKPIIGNLPPIPSLPVQSRPVPLKTSQDPLLNIVNCY